jgi:glucose/arabinose dehydrogenase
MQSPSSIAAGGEAVDLQSTSPFQAMSYATLEEPWALAFEPGTGRLFITQKGGTAKLFDPATGQMREVTGLPDIAYGGQGGLGDVAFGPDYSSTGTIYLS